MQFTIRVLAPLGIVTAGLLLAASCSGTAPHTGPGSWPLEGAHAATTCNSCHQNSFTERPTRCSSCHDRPQSHIDDVEQPERAELECSACHTPFAWVLGSPDTGGDQVDCTACHGEPGGSPAPTEPGQDLPENDDPLSIIDPIGDHEAHVILEPSGDSYAIASCTACHVEVERIDDPGHIDPVGQEDPAEIVFGDIATEGAATWDPATGTCSNTYCHGGSASMADAEGEATAPVWGGDVSCGDCHALPSLQSHDPGDLVCDDCHPPISPDTHVNGFVNLIQ